MVVSTTTNRVETDGDGTSTVFSYPIYFLDPDDLEVLLVDASGNETTQTITTHYSVAFTDANDKEQGGSVTMVTPPATGEKLIIFRDPQPLQNTDYQDNDPFQAATTEQALDLLMMLIIRLFELIGQSFRVTDGTGAVPEITPDPDTVLVIDQDGNPGSLSTQAPRFNNVDDDYTLVSADMTNTVVVMDAATAKTITVPLNSVVGSGPNTAIIFSNVGAGQLTIQFTGAATINSNAAGSIVIDQFAGAAIFCPQQNDEWFANGNYT